MVICVPSSAVLTPSPDITDWNLARPMSVCRGFGEVIKYSARLSNDTQSWYQMGITMEIT